MGYRVAPSHPHEHRAHEALPALWALRRRRMGRTRPQQRDPQSRATATAIQHLSLPPAPLLRYHPARPYRVASPGGQQAEPALHKLHATDGALSGGPRGGPGAGKGTRAAGSRRHESVRRLEARVRRTGKESTRVRSMGYRESGVFIRPMKGYLRLNPRPDSVAHCPYTRFVHFFQIPVINNGWQMS